MRGTATRKPTTWEATAKARSVASGSPPCQSKPRLPPGWIGAPSSDPGTVDTVSSPYSIAAASAPSAAAAAVVAMTSATASPANRRRSRAKAGRGGTRAADPSRLVMASSAVGTPGNTSSRSEAANTATTPGTARAACRSSERSSAWARADRTKRALRVSVPTCSLVYRQAPRSMGPSSVRPEDGAIRSRPCSSAQSRRHARPSGPRRDGAARR